MNYRGQRVLVTGASSGIGREAARAFAARGATVIATARREDRLQALVEEIAENSPDSSYRAGDIGDRHFAESLIEEATAGGRKLDILVNNAGMPMHRHVSDLSPDLVERLFAVNFFSTVWTTLAAIPHMIEAGGGSIINISSFAALVAPPREAIYAASKAAMNSFTEGLWHDLAGSNVHVGVINPGPIDTEIWEIDGPESSYRGHRYPPSLVADAIFEVIERKRFEVTIPRRHPALVSARALRLLWPRMLRWGMRRFEPPDPNSSPLAASGKPRGPTSE